MTTQPHGNMSVLRNRSSFEDLQDCDEETAMKLAMAASAENFSQSDSLMIDESHEYVFLY